MSYFDQHRATNSFCLLFLFFFLLFWWIIAKQKLEGKYAIDEDDIAPLPGCVLCQAFGSTNEINPDCYFQDVLLLVSIKSRSLETGSSHRHIDGSLRERCNSITNALELRLSCTNPSILFMIFDRHLSSGAACWDTSQILQWSDNTKIPYGLTKCEKVLGQCPQQWPPGNMSHLERTKITASYIMGNVYSQSHSSCCVGFSSVYQQCNIKPGRQNNIQGGDVIPA